MSFGKNRTSISIDELIRIKEKFGASIQCLFIRAKSTGIIDEDTYNQWWQDYKEWPRENESNSFGAYRSLERTTKFNQLLTQTINEKRISWSKAAELKGVKVDILKSQLQKLKFELN